MAHRAIPVTRENATTARYFHESGACPVKVTEGPRGGKSYSKSYLWRRNGATQTWKREPERFRIPVKYGLYEYGQITNNNAGHWHVGFPEECQG